VNIVSNLSDFFAGHEKHNLVQIVFHTAA